MHSIWGTVSDGSDSCLALQIKSSMPLCYQNDKELIGGAGIIVGRKKNTF